ncbi:hypothetical protein GQ457_07G003890 [Hibiscus cannabinus]
MSHQRSMYNNRKQEEELKRLTLVHPNNQESKVRKLLPEACKNCKSQFPETREVGAKKGRVGRLGFDSNVVLIARSNIRFPPKPRKKEEFKSELVEIHSEEAKVVDVKLVQKITVHNAAISSVMSKIVIKHHDRNDPFLCCKREEEKKRFKSKPSTTLAMQKRQHIFCGCWDSSPGLHGHNVEFSPLNYSHMLMKSNQYYKTYRNYIN